MAELKALRGFMMSTSKDLGFLDLAWPVLWCVLHGAQWRFQRCAEFRFGMQLSGFIVQATTKSRILGIHMDSSKAENQGRSTWYLFPWCYGNWCRSLMQHQQLLTTMQVQKNTYSYGNSGCTTPERWTVQLFWKKSKNNWFKWWLNLIKPLVAVDNPCS